MYTKVSLRERKPVVQEERKNLIYTVLHHLTVPDYRGVHCLQVAIDNNVRVCRYLCVAYALRMRCEAFLTRLRLGLARLRIRNVNPRLTLRSATNEESIPGEGLPYKVNPGLTL